MNTPIRLSLFEVLGLMRGTDGGDGQLQSATDLAESIDDDVNDYNGDRFLSGHGYGWSDQ